VTRARGLFAVLALLATAAMADRSTASEQFGPTLRARYGNANVQVCRDGNLALLGEISQNTANFLRDCLASRAYRSLHVDLRGGDVAAALDMAQALDDFDVEVVVDGLCFSACADYLLPAARKVRILPGSLVGIHDRRLRHVDRNGRIVFEHLSPDVLSGQDAEVMARFRVTEEARRAFLRKHGRGEPFLDTYLRYLERRKRFLWGKAASSFLCPYYDIWVLDKAQLRAFGIRDIDTQWTPDSRQQVDAIARSRRMGGRFFFGSASALDRQCTFAGIFAR
jgi:hypothetical protein